MPNHVHLLVEPGTDTALSDYMQWVTGNYACWWRQRTLTLGHGHVFQRRFWSAPVTNAEYFFDVLRYIEANPARAGLVSQAEDWEWSSLPERSHATPATISPPPLTLPAEWGAVVNAGQRAETLSAIRSAIAPKVGRPRKDSQALAADVRKSATKMGQAPFSPQDSADPRPGLSPDR